MSPPDGTAEEKTDELLKRVGACEREIKSLQFPAALPLARDVDCTSAEDVADEGGAKVLAALMGRPVGSLIVEYGFRGVGSVYVHEAGVGEPSDLEFAVAEAQATWPLAVTFDLEEVKRYIGATGASVHQLEVGDGNGRKQGLSLCWDGSTGYGIAPACAVERNGLVLSVVPHSIHTAPIGHSEERQRLDLAHLVLPATDEQGGDAEGSAVFTLSALPLDPTVVESKAALMAFEAAQLAAAAAYADDLQSVFAGEGSEMVDGCVLTLDSNEGPCLLLAPATVEQLGGPAALWQLVASVEHATPPLAFFIPAFLSETMVLRPHAKLGCIGAVVGTPAPAGGLDWVVTPFCSADGEGTLRPKPLAQGNVRCELRRRFGRRCHPDPLVEAGIAATWESTEIAATAAKSGRGGSSTKAARKISHLPTFRLHGYELGGGGGGGGGGSGSNGGGGAELCLQLGLTDARSFLGTNACTATQPSLQRRLLADGAAHYRGNSLAYLSQRLGVSGITTTSDGFLVFLVRGGGGGTKGRGNKGRGKRSRVGLAGGLPQPARVPGLEAALGPASVAVRSGDGTGSEGVEGSWDEEAEQDAVSLGMMRDQVLEQLFGGVAGAVVAEIHAPIESLCAPLLLGVAYDRHAEAVGTPTAVFALRCQLTKHQLEVRFAEEAVVARCRRLRSKEAEQQASSKPSSPAPSSSSSSSSSPPSSASTQLCFVQSAAILSALQQEEVAAEEDNSSVCNGVPLGEVAVAAAEACIAPLRFTPTACGGLALWAEHRQYGGLAPEM